MNKLLLVLLAVCLVSVHAFVKRDTAPATQKNPLDDLGKLAEDFGNELKKNFDPEKIKKDFTESIDKISDAAKKLLDQSQDAPKA